MIYIAEYKEQLLALGVIPSAPDSEAKSLANLKADLDKEKATRVIAQVEADVISRAVCDLKVTADKFASQIPTLEDKVVEGLKEVRA
jgi:hypothetical protein